MYTTAYTYTHKVSLLSKRENIDTKSQNYDMFMYTKHVCAFNKRRIKSTMSVTEFQSGYFTITCFRSQYCPA